MLVLDGAGLPSPQGAVAVGGGRLDWTVHVTAFAYFGEVSVGLCKAGWWSC